MELLKNQLVEGERALDIGSGSGYLTTCMAIMLGENGKAVGIDHIPELVEKSIQNVRKDNPQLLNSQRVIFEGKSFRYIFIKFPSNENACLTFF